MVKSPDETFLEVDISTEYLKLITHEVFKFEFEKYANFMLSNFFTYTVV